MTMPSALRALVEQSAAKYRAEEVDPCEHICRHVCAIDEITRMQASSLTRARTMLSATTQFAKGLSLSKNDRDALRSMLTAVGTRIDLAERQSHSVRERARDIMAEADAVSAESRN